MSEREFTPVAKDERDDVTRLKAQLAKAEFDASQKEVFGKFDVVVPNEGEETYQSYLDQRPKDGVVRDGEGLRNTATGKYASSAEYTASNGTATEYFNAQVERSAEGQVAYADMSMQELARKYGESEAANDKTMALDVLESIDAKINEYAEKYNWSTETKDQHYDALMEVADKASHAPSVEADAEKVVANQKEVPSEVVEDATDTEVSADAAVVENVRPPEGVPAQDGESQEQHEARNSIVVDTLEDVKLASSPEDSPKVDTLEDIKLADVPGVEADDKKLDKEGSDVEKKSIWKKISEKTTKLRDRIYTTYGMATYGVGRLMAGPKPEDGESKEAYEKRSKKYGNRVLIGTLALVGAAVAAKLLIDLPDGNGGNAPAQESFGASGGGYSTPESNIEIPEPSVEAPVVPEFSADAHTVTDGEGWYNTMKEMGITDATERASLLQKVGPQLQEMGYAYPMVDGTWGINLPGQLPGNVLELIQNSR